MQLCHCPPISALRRDFSSRIPAKIKLVYSRRINVIKRDITVDIRNALTGSVRLRTLLPRILSKERFSAWNQALEHVATCHSNTKYTKRIAAYGLDRLADPHTLVTALLDDPFASPRDDMKALRNRHTNHHDEPVIIALKDTPRSPNSTVGLSRVELNLPRLAYFNAEILEIPFLHPDALPLLWSADVRLLVATPLVSPLTPDFLSPILHPSTLLIIQHSGNDQTIIHHTLSSLTNSQPEMMSSVPVHAVNAHKALSTSDTFRLNPSNIDSVNTFQRDYLESGLSSIIQKVHSLLSMPEDVLKAKKPASIIIGALDACYESIRLSKADISAALEQINTLQLNVNSIRGTAKLEAIPGPYRLDIPDSIRKSTRKMSDVLQKISWWKLPLAVDDLSHIFADTIQRTWCSDVVSHADYQAGRLSLLRKQAISQTTDCYFQLPKPFQSAILKNALDQHSSELNEIGPSALSYPVTHRIKQLGEPVIRLHRQVQNALLASYCGILGSFGAPYIAWYGQYTTGYNAVGLSALGIVIVLRLFMRRWDKVKKKWWADLNRAGQGLERDMKDVIEKAIEEKVLIVPLEAIEILQDVIQKRTKELDAMQQELDEVKDGLEDTQG